MRHLGATGCETPRDTRGLRCALKIAIPDVPELLDPEAECKPPQKSAPDLNTRPLSVRSARWREKEKERKRDIDLRQIAGRFWLECLGST